MPTDDSGHPMTGETRVLVRNWRKVLKHAWSIRFIYLAALLSGAEIVLPLFSDALPRGWFAAATFLAVSGAFVSRLVVQQRVGGRDGTNDAS